MARLLGPPASATGARGEKEAERPAAWKGIEIGDDIICFVGDDMLPVGEDKPVWRPRPPPPINECLRWANPCAAAVMCPDDCPLKRNCTVEFFKYCFALLPP